MREIKFRFWLANNHEPRMHYFDLRDEDLNFRAIIDRGSVLLQYTGLKDKNGVEIYEGDIVNITTNWISDLAPDKPPTTSTKAVEFVKGSFQLGHGGFFSNGFIERGELEVIGNIYENNELLNV